MRGTEERAPLKVALLGCGVVGSQVYRLLTEQSADLKARAGAPLEIVGCVARCGEEAGTSPAMSLSSRICCTTDGLDLVTRPGRRHRDRAGSAGDRASPGPCSLAALSAGKSVVDTANKALVAADRAILHKTASQALR